MSTRLDIEPDHARSEARTNMFVMASVSATTASGAVKIRNLSPHGALIESAALPAVGEPVELKRGPLFAAGQVTWRQGNKAGLRFDRPIEVIDWLPSAHSGQQSVENAFQQVKAGLADDSRTELPVERDLNDPEKFRRIARALDRLADALADDAAIVMRHPEKLQVLDIASQMLRKLAAADSPQSR